MRRALAAAVTILTLAAPARADAEEKDPGIALFSALGGTALGVGLYIGWLRTDEDLLLAGAAVAGVVGPAGGHLYLGEYKHPILTSLARAAAIASTVAGASLIFAEHEDYQDLASFLFWGGGIAYVGVTGYDIIDAPLAARRHNDRVRARVAPTWIDGAPGLTIAGTF